MSRENLEVLRSMYAAFSTLAEGGDVASYVDAFYHPECEYHPIEEQDVVRGRDALVRWNRRWFEVWDEFQAQIDEVIETPDAVVTGITVQGRGDNSGIEISQRLFHVSELRDGRILRMQEYVDRAQALEAAGRQ